MSSDETLDLHVMAPRASRLACKTLGSIPPVSVVPCLQHSLLPAHLSHILSYSDEYSSAWLDAVTSLDCLILRRLICSSYIWVRYGW